MPMLILLECENSSDHVSTSIVLIIPKKLLNSIANKAIAIAMQ